MTLINLLPPEIIEKRKKRQQYLLIVSLSCVYGMILATIFFYLNMQKQRLKAEIEDLKREIAVLAPTIEKIKKIEAENAKIKKRLSIINNLIKGRFRWVKVMDKLSDTLTPDVWLNNFSPVKPDGIRISCQAFSNYAVANFMISLMDSPFFSNVELVGGVSGVEIKSFCITCKYHL
jgi:Tfp pilus assembly protein PilN